MLVLFVASIAIVVLYKFVPPPVTPLMLERQSSDNAPIHYYWTPLKEITPDLALAVVASEDNLFTTHNGFDFEQIKIAREEAEKGKKLRGASTISQQTAKNVFLWHGRSWLRKGLEAYFTTLIELIWGKERIMEVYLNSIEMGNGIYGADAVAEYHFSKTAADLSRSDCALIAATLPNPLKFDSSNPNGKMRNRQHKIEHEMKFIPTFPKEGEDINPHSASGGVYRNMKK